MHPEARVVTAPAKINLYLAVGATRPDGYHDVETVLQAVSLSDRLTIEPADELSLASNVDLGIPAHENLVYIAAAALQRDARVEVGAKITLHKAIPSGAGLGGGSSDAAAALLGLSELWELDEEYVLSDLAADLGADVPFFVQGGTAHLDGRGDRVRHRLPSPDLAVALVKPDATISTADAYRAFDEHPASVSPGIEPMLAALDDGDEGQISASLHNNMTKASSGLEPSIAEAIAWCETAPGVLGTAMAGSGSAVFSICSGESAAAEVVRNARARGLWAEAARTVSHGVRSHAAEEAM